MRFVDKLPRGVDEIEHLWIPVSDGTRLAARVWLPEGAAEGPVPALLEYIPYGKREGTRLRDESLHRYMAGHGVAGVRVDLRGSGESEGVLLDEYLPQEHEDGLDVIAWIAAQPWCDGHVCLIGKSWGGFGALQIAAHAPPALRGVIVVCASDDRYADDAHYMGGCLLHENFRWGAALFHLVALPPDPALVGSDWREMWEERLDHAQPFAALWLRHPLRDAYWRRGSVCEDYGRIRCPVFAVGGWADGYSNAVPRLLAGLPDRSWGLVGPWAHVYPHEGTPGPAIDFLREVLRFVDACVRAPDTLGAWPRYRVWLQESFPPGPARQRVGRWIEEPTWPSPHVVVRRERLGPEGTLVGPTRLAAPDPVAGLAAGAWCAFGPNELPGDQAVDDAHALCFDSAPLTERVEILGAPAVDLDLAVDRSTAFVVVRLVDLRHDGTASRVSYGLLNLTHRDDHTALEPRPPGERRRVRVSLADAAHAFPPGHRLRVAVSTAYWPLVWPSPEPVGLRLFDGALELPVRATGRDYAPGFAGAEGARPSAVIDVDAGGLEHRIRRDPARGVEIELRHDLDPQHRPALTRYPDIDLEAGYGGVERLRIDPRDPLSARTELRHVSLLARADWRVRVETHTSVRSDHDQFHVRAELRAYLGDDQVFSRSWLERIPRRGV